jgi:hypothetical protein
MNGTSLLSKKDCGDRNPDDLDEHLSGGHQGIEEPGPEENNGKNLEVLLKGWSYGDMRVSRNGRKSIESQKCSSREITMTILVGFNGWSHVIWVGNINSRSGSF